MGLDYFRYCCFNIFDRIDLAVDQFIDHLFISASIGKERLYLLPEIAFIVCVVYLIHVNMYFLSQNTHTVDWPCHAYRTSIQSTNRGYSTVHSLSWT